MLQTVWKSIDLAYRRFLDLFADPNVSDERRLQKNVLITACLMGVPAFLSDVPKYLAYDEPLAAAVNIVTASAIALSLIIYRLFRRYQFFYFSLLPLFLLTSLAIWLTLGGFANSSAIVLTAFFPALVALLGDEPKEATFWFAGFVLLVIATTVLEPYVVRPTNLPPEIIASIFAQTLLVISSLIFFFTRYFISQKNRAYALLALEREKSENLLLNILPREIAERLKNESGIIADRFDGVSILFADMVDFTPMSAEMEPEEMVGLLNEVFSHFDSLVEKHDLEKIKTVGDAYMVAAGVPRPRRDHAEIIATMALEMRSYVTNRSPDAEKPLGFRIGIDSGSVIAGVIGHKKFQYDMWGDVVNTASRMESHGEGGKIQITQQTYQLLKNGFVCEGRGKVMVKGKGEMDTWYLVGSKPNGK